VGLVSLIFKLQIHKPSTIIHRPIHVLHTGLVITIDVLGLVDEPAAAEAVVTLETQVDAGGAGGTGGAGTPSNI
jgi:hypothetical protein